MKRFILLFLFIFSQIEAAENSTLLYYQGRELALNGDIEAAAEKFKQSIKLSPYYVLPHYGLGRCYLNMEGKRKEAIRELRISIKLDKKFSPAYFYLGLAYMFEKQYAYALNQFKNALLYDNTRTEALYNIGAVYDLMGHPNKSLLYYDQYLRAIKTDSDYRE
ncbi:MAG TPA: tetratricopeptide repeat protein [Spirochaetota bacterium]|nr:tetratricopeptide repeat protein [Spirochaetota bacterium]